MAHFSVFHNFFGPVIVPKFTAPNEELLKDAIGIALFLLKPCLSDAKAMLVRYWLAARIYPSEEKHVSAMLAL